MWIAVLLIVIFIIYAVIADNKKKPPAKNEVKLNHPNDDSTDSVDKIYKEVEKRKKQAVDDKIYELIKSLYCDESIPHYPSWIANEKNRSYVPIIIKDSVKNDYKENNYEKKETKLVIDNHNFIFRFWHTSNFDGMDYNKFELDFNQSKVFGMSFTIDHGEWGSSWSKPFEINSYIPGEWTDILKSLLVQIKNDQEIRKKAQKEDPAKLEKMKKDFGLS